jgi:hypothetical protein
MPLNRIDKLEYLTKKFSQRFENLFESGKNKIYNTFELVMK